MMIRVKFANGAIVRHHIDAWLHHTHRNGRAHGVIYLQSGEAVRVEKRNPKSTFYVVTGRAK